VARSSEVKRPEHKADHYSSSRTEVKITWLGTCILTRAQWNGAEPFEV
jgi:hypothetical protein